MNRSYRVYSALPILKEARAWIEINTAAIRRNYRALCDFARKNGSNAVISGVIKAEGYGHGAASLTELLLLEGCRFYCAAGIDEATAIRGVCDRMGIEAEILLLGYTPVSNADELLRYRITQSVFSLDYAKELSAEVQRLGGCLPVHIKINSGMNRLGFPVNSGEELERALEDISEVVSLDGLSVRGAFTHFARADDRTKEGVERTRLQAERFYEFSRRAASRGIELGKLHLCASAATLLFPEFHSDICRAGLALYGLGVPSDVDIKLESALKLKSQIAQVNTLYSGSELGYGGAYRASGKERVATVGVGYADGFLRAYSGSRVVIHSASGKYIGEGKVIGRVCMDQCFISVGELDVKRGDIVTLLGEGEQISELAAKLDTVEHEILTVLSARLPRFVYEN